MALRSTIYWEPHVQGVKVDIPALVNDTVGTLACARYGDGMHQTDTAMSLIVGTGAPTRGSMRQVR